MATEPLVIQVRADGIRQVQRDLDLIGRSGVKAGTSAANMNKEFSRTTRSATGLRTVSRDVTTIGKSTDAATNSVRGLVKGLAAIGAGVALKSVIGQFSSFENQLIGIGKTTNIAGTQLQGLGRDIQTMARTLPVATNELLSIGQSAGQLGVNGRDNILAFVETVGRIGLATDLAGDTAATAFARILTVTGEPQRNVDRLGAALVQLGNNFAATESEIAHVATRVGQATSQFDLNAAAVLGISTALKALGVRAELGGSVVGRAFQSMNAAIRGGGEAMQALQGISGLTATQLERDFRDRPEVVFRQFITGLGQIKDSGGDVSEALARMGLKGNENIAVLATLASRSDVLTDALDQSASAWESNTALIAESEQAATSFSSEMQRLGNRVSEIAVALGRELAPTIRSLSEAFAPVAAFLVENIGAIKLAIELMAAALVGRALAGLLRFGATALTAAKGLGTFTLAARAASLAMTGPVGIGLAIAGIIGGSFGLKALQGHWEDNAKAADTFTKSIEDLSDKFELLNKEMQVSEVLRLQKNLADTQQHISDLTREISEAELQLEGFAELAQKEGRIPGMEDAQSTVGLLRQKIVDLNLELRASEKDFATASAAVKTFEGVISEAAKRGDRFIAEVLAGFRRNLPPVITDAEKLTEAWKKQNAALEDLEYDQAINGVSAYNRELMNSTDLQDQLQGALNQSVDELHNYIDSAGPAVRETKLFQATVADLRENVDTARTALATMNLTMSDLRGITGSLGTEGDKLTNTLADLRTQQDTLNKAQDSAIGQTAEYARAQTLLAQEIQEVEFRQRELNGEVGAAEAFFVGARRGAQDFFDGLGTASERAASTVSQGIGTMRDTLAEFFNTGRIDGENFWGSMRELASNFFANELVALADGGQSTLLSFFTGAQEQSNTTSTVLQEGATTAFGVINESATESQGIIGTVFSAIGEGATLLWDGVSSVAGTAWDFITSRSGETQVAVGGDFGTMAAAGTSMFTGLSEESSGFWSGFRSLAQGGLDFLGTVWSGMRDGALSFISSVGSAFNGFISSIASGLRGFAGSVPSLIGGAISALGGVIGRAVDLGVNVVRGAISTVSSLARGFFSTGGIVEGLATGGQVQGYASGGATIPAGSYVINAASTNRYSDIIGALGGVGIRGPGTGTSDSILASTGSSLIAVSNGESFIPPAATKKYGGLIEAINSGKLAAFAEGGGVSTIQLDTSQSTFNSIASSMSTIGDPFSTPDESRDQQARLSQQLEQNRLAEAEQSVRRTQSRVLRVLTGIAGFLIGGPLGGMVSLLGGLGSNYLRTGSLDASFRGLLTSNPTTPTGAVGAALFGIGDFPGILENPSFFGRRRRPGPITIDDGNGGGVAFDNEFGGPGSGRDSFQPFVRGQGGDRFREGVIDIASAARDRLGGGITSEIQRLAANTNTIMERDINLPLIGLPGRRHGGPVRAGVPHLVGEGGKPEVYIPDTNGRVAPINSGGGSLKALEEKLERLVRHTEEQNREIAALRREVEGQTDPIKRTARAADRQRLAMPMDGRAA